MDLFAVMAGVAVAMGLGGLVGAVLGAALIADSRDADDSDPQATFEAQLHSPTLLLQLSVLSLMVAVLSGAVTGWLAPGAPLLNAGLVGALGTGLGLALPAPGFPDRPRLILALLTLPATLAGGWLMTLAG